MEKYSALIDRHYLAYTVNGHIKKRPKFIENKIEDFFLMDKGVFSLDIYAKLIVIDSNIEKNLSLYAILEHKKNYILVTHRVFINNKYRIDQEELEKNINYVFEEAPFEVETLKIVLPIYLKNRKRINIRNKKNLNKILTLAMSQKRTREIIQDYIAPKN